MCQSYEATSPAPKPYTPPVADSEKSESWFQPAPPVATVEYDVEGNVVDTRFTDAVMVSAKTLNGEARVLIDFSKVADDKLEALVTALYHGSFGTDLDDIKLMIANRSTKLLLATDDGDIGDLLMELVGNNVTGIVLEIEAAAAKPAFVDVGGSGEPVYVTFSVDVGAVGNPVYEHLAASFVVPEPGTTKISIGKNSLIQMIGSIAVETGYNILGIIDAQQTEDQAATMVLGNDLSF